MNTEWNPSKKGNHYVWRGVFLWKMTNHRNKTNPSSAHLHQPSVPLSFLSTGGKMRQSNAANCHRSNSDSGAQTEIKLFICIGTVTAVSVWPLHIKKNKFFLPFSFELTEIIWFYLSFGERMLLSSRELFPITMYRAERNYLCFAGLYWNTGFKKMLEYPGSQQVNVLEEKKCSKWFTEFWLREGVWGIPGTCLQAGNLWERETSGHWSFRWVA